MHDSLHNRGRNTKTKRHLPKLKLHIRANNRRHMTISLSQRDLQVRTPQINNRKKFSSSKLINQILNPRQWEMLRNDVGIYTCEIPTQAKWELTRDRLLIHHHNSESIRTGSINNIKAQSR